METILSAAATSLIGGAVSKLFGNKPEAAPPPPVVAPPVEMPDPLAQQAKARRKAAIGMSRQLSAANTVLTGGDNKLGA
jgi:hypothetical protein